MTQDISAFGFQVQIVAIPTFPQGINITQFADDADPMDVPSQQLRDKAMGSNGDLIGWSKAVPITATLNVIPDSDDDKNLAILAENNRAAQGKKSSVDDITMTIIYPNGIQKTLSGGFITDGIMTTGIASSGRKKTKTYMFAFQNQTVAQL